MSDIQPQRLKRLLRRMVDIYSPSGKEEDILEYLYGYARRQGLSVTRQYLDENRYNLLVLPPDEDVVLALIGHVDTVAAYDLEDYGFSEDGDQIGGLGTADMKAGCAAMLEAFLALGADSAPLPPVALCLVVGEEEEGDGAEKLTEDYHFPWAIIGEPTQLQPCLSNYGYLEIETSTLGKRIHASLANRDQNPVETMMRLILKVSQYLEGKHPELVFNIRDLYSSHAGFAVPDRCEAWLDVHLPPSAPIGEITTDLEGIFVEQREANIHIEASSRIVTIDAGYELPEKGPLVEALKDTYAGHGLPWDPQTFRSHSDANQLWTAGVKAVLLGPGQLEKAHTPEESVSFQQVCKAAQLYHDLAKNIRE